MGKRHEVIGIKQVIRLEWMQQTVNLLLSGMDVKGIRQELHEFLSNRNGDGSEKERGETSRSQVVNILMNIWITPSVELIEFRNDLLLLVQESHGKHLPIHWSMITAAYPFWFNVAQQTGRLLALQSQVTQAQIISRIKELYGDRQTVSRYARSVIRSFVTWGVLKDSGKKGCYEKNTLTNVEGFNLAILMYESALHSIPEAKGAMTLLSNSPSFFPFQLPVITGDFISQHSNRIDVIRYGLDDELLELNN